MAYATALTLSYDTSKPSRWPRAYRVYLGQSGEHAYPMRQEGPVYNGVVSYRGAYDDRGDALRAALEQIGSPCSLVEHRHPMAGSIVHTVEALSYKPGEGSRVIARRLAHGVWIAD